MLPIEFGHIGAQAECASALPAELALQPAALSPQQAGSPEK